MMNDPVIARRIRERLAKTQYAEGVEHWATSIIDEDESNNNLPEYHVRINFYLRDVIDRATMMARIERYTEEVYEQGCDYIIRKEGNDYLCMLVDDQREVIVTTVDPNNSATWTTKDA